MSGSTRAITMRCVREFEAAGIAGIHIEDQVYPKRASYHKGLEHIVPLQEFVERMTYPLHARRDQDFIIIGRPDAFSEEGVGVKIVTAFPPTVQGISKSRSQATHRCFSRTPATNRALTRASPRSPLPPRCCACESPA
jgi:isocitrate lyase